MSNQDLIILLIFVFSFMVSTFVLLFLEDIINWNTKKYKKEVNTMKYWKKKIKKEFNVYIKKIKLKNERGVFICYVAYETVNENAYQNAIDVKKEIFKDPRDIWTYLKQQEMQEEIKAFLREQQTKENGKWVEHTLKNIIITNNKNF